MVNSNTRSNGAWFDIRGIQTDGRVDTGIRSSVMSQFKRSLSMLPPADIVNIGLGLSSVPAVDMTGDSGEVLASLQETNEELAQVNKSMAARIAHLQAKPNQSGP
jgi:hypothetical protein